MIDRDCSRERNKTLSSSRRLLFFIRFDYYEKHTHTQKKEKTKRERKRKERKKKRETE